MQAEYVKVTERIKELKDIWLPKMNVLVNAINSEFSESFRRLNCLGECRLLEHETDYKECVLCCL